MDCLQRRNFKLEARPACECRLRANQLRGIQFVGRRDTGRLAICRPLGRPGQAADWPERQAAKWPAGRVLPRRDYLTGLFALSQQVASSAAGGEARREKQNGRSTLGQVVTRPSRPTLNLRQAAQAGSLLATCVRYC